jgi:hypothetical protein
MYLLIGILLAVLTVGSTALLLWQKKREAKTKVAKQRVTESRDSRLAAHRHAHHERAGAPGL